MTEIPSDENQRVRSKLAQTLLWMGRAALLGAFLFLGAALARLDWTTLLERFSVLGWTVTAIAALAYAALLALLARAWSGDAAREQSTPGWLDSIAVYGPGAIAKYIPGSVFQYASRQARGARCGWSHRAMARASLIEALLHLPGALLVAGVLAWTQTPFVLLPLTLAGATLTLLAGPDRTLARAAGLQLCFFSGFGLIATALMGSAIGIGPAASISAMFMLAWIAGFLIPLAPGGVGVRESALLLLASPIADTETILAFALVTRLVTTAGDAIFGLSAFMLEFRYRGASRGLG